MRAQRKPRRKPAPVVVVTDRARVNYEHLSHHAPTPAARAYWAAKAHGRTASSAPPG